MAEVAVMKVLNEIEQRSINRHRFLFGMNKHTQAVVNKNSLARL